MTYEALSPVNFDSAGSCLFINEMGKLFRVYCPFQVVCQITYPPYQAGQIALVTRIGSGVDKGVLYEIEHQYHPHYWFALYL